MSKHKHLADRAEQAAELVIGLAIEEAVTVSQRRNGGQDASGPAFGVVGLLIAAGALRDLADGARAVRKGRD